MEAERKRTDCRRPDDQEKCANCTTCREPCQVYDGDKPCGETQTLQIVKEFKELYEKKMHEIESTGGGDCVQAKISLQEDWIRDLTEQNEMLVKAVEDLEQEATERVRLLERKLNKTATAEMEVIRKYSQLELAFNITDALQQQAYLRNDITNLLEFIKRIRENNVWDTDGLQFYHVTCTDLFGCCKTDPEKRLISQSSLAISNEQQQVRSSDDNDNSKKRIAELEEQLKKVDKLGGMEQVLKKLQEYDNLKQSMLEMRDALTIEVAEKHDIILSLKRDIQHLEEQCRQTNKHAQFKDDIIKELRREVKQLKQQDIPQKNTDVGITAEIPRKDTTLEEENEKLKAKLQAIQSELEEAQKEAKKNLKEKECYEKKYTDSLNIVESVTTEISMEKDKLAKKHEESLTVIETLKAENEQQKDAIENVRKSSKSAVENLERALMQDLTEARRKQNESLEKVGTLQSQLEKLNNDLREANNRVSFLTEENHKLNNTIDKLKSELQEKRRKILMSNSGTNPRKRKVENGGTCTECPDSRDHGIQFDSEANNQSKISALEEKLASVNNNLKLIKNKDEVIKIQNDTLNIVQIELQALRNKEAAIELERNKRNQEITNLKKTIEELENVLKNCKNRGDNLQKAVDLYLNSIKVLEESEVRAQTEIQQQRITITNLQEAVIAAKHELEELKQRNSNEQSQHFYIVDVLLINLLYLENQYSSQYRQLNQLNNVISNLRDTVLDLEVEKVDCIKDISMLETRLQKYQCHFSLNEGCVCPLKAQIKKLTLENDQYEKVIQYLKEEMQMLAEQLANLQNILSASNTNTIEENSHLIQTITELQTVNTQLQDEITKQMKINEVNSVHIAELQKMLEKKEIEVQEWQNSLREKDASLEASIMQSFELQKFIEQLQENGTQIEQSAPMAGDNICNCKGKGKMSEMKEKLHQLADVVQKKTTEVSELKEKVAEQNEKFNIAKIQLEENKRKMREEIIESQHTISELNDKIKALQMTSQPNLKDVAVETIESQNKQLEIMEHIKQLEQQIANFQEQLMFKDEELSTARIIIQQLRADGNTQEEVMTLKEEINKLLQVQTQLKKENEKLRAQVTRLKANVTSYQEQTHTVGEQLEQCLLELQALQADKDAVDQKNEQLFIELQSMQSALANAKKELSIKTKELHDRILNQNHMVDESKYIVDNVRAWLNEHTIINNRLKKKLIEKDTIIQQLQQQNNNIIDKLAYFEKSYEPQLVPSKLKSHHKEIYPTSANESLSHWSSGSRITSAIVSGPESNSENMHEWYTYSDAEDEKNFTPEKWIRRVESMTIDLQRSNEYWQNMIPAEYIVRN